jgi:ribosome recycling factor
MKKFTWLLVAILVVSIVFGSVGIVSAGNGNGKGNGNVKANGNGKPTLQQKINAEIALKDLRAKIEAGEHLGILAKKVADFLGMKVSDLIKEEHSGKSLVQIAQEKGKTEQDLINAIFAPYKSQLDKLLSDGKITQDQYNDISTNIQNLIKKIVERVPQAKTTQNPSNP